MILASYFLENYWSCSNCYHTQYLYKETFNTDFFFLLQTSVSDKKKKEYKDTSPVLPELCAAVHLVSGQTNSQRRRRGASPEHDWRVLIARLQFHLVVGGHGVGVSAVAPAIFLAGSRIPDLYVLLLSSRFHCFFLYIICPVVPLPLMP
jgi:hypothetical protein